MNSLTFAATAGSVSFAMTLFVTVIRAFESRAWFLIPLVASALLEVVGFASLSYYSSNPTHHVAFLASFTATTIAPVMLAFANAATFDKLVRVVIYKDGSVPARKVKANHAVSALVSYGPFGASLITLSLGLWDISRFLSPAPIAGLQGAAERLALHDRGVAAVANGQLLLLVGLSLFGLVAMYQTHKLQNLGFRDKELVAAWMTVVVSNALLWIRSVSKVVEVLGSSRNVIEMTETSTWFWINDALPMLAAITLYCVLHPGALSKLVPAARLMLTTEEPSGIDMYHDDKNDVEKELLAELD